MNYLIGLAAMWIFSDGIYSYVLYKNTQSWRGEKQNFAKDHWVRLVRCILAVFIMVVAWK